MIIRRICNFRSINQLLVDKRIITIRTGNRFPYYNSNLVNGPSRGQLYNRDKNHWKWWLYPQRVRSRMDTGKPCGIRLWRMQMAKSELKLRSISLPAVEWTVFIGNGMEVRPQEKCSPIPTNLGSASYCRYDWLSQPARLLEVCLIVGLQVVMLRTIEIQVFTTFP